MPRKKPRPIVHTPNPRPKTPDAAEARCADAGALSERMTRLEQKVEAAPHAEEIRRKLFLVMVERFRDAAAELEANLKRAQRSSRALWCAIFFVFMVSIVAVGLALHGFVPH